MISHPFHPEDSGEMFYPKTTIKKIIHFYLIYYCMYICVCAQVDTVSLSVSRYVCVSVDVCASSEIFMCL